MTKQNRLQDIFWSSEYAKSYAAKNQGFDNELGGEAWSQILSGAKLIEKTFLEVGCNIGRNIDQLKLYDENLRPSAIEINESALELVKGNHKLDVSVSGAAQDVQLPPGRFELVFTSGVLIHVPPADLLLVMEKMYEWSSKYIVIAEYFNRTPVSIEYQGRPDLLFKRDFGGLFLDNFPVSIVSYGFLWGRIYDSAGFDDITWWLFEKQDSTSSGKQSANFK
jgi:pseudaminic acid biosynthesis-associated methylase